MKNSVLKIFALAIAGTVMASMVGCGSSKTPTTQADDKVSISIMDMFPSGATDGNSIAFINTMKEFKKENPNITINEEALNPNTYETKISTIAAGNQLPDIFIVKGSMLNEFIKNNLIQPIDDIINNDSAWKNGFYPGIFNDFVVNGKTYGVPFQKLDTHLIFYNQKIFNECGITAFPTTWSEFKDAINKIKAKGITPISMGNKDNWVAESCLMSTLGDRFTGVDWVNKIKAKSGAKFTDPEFVKSLTALQELSKMGAFNSDINSIDNMQQKTNYYNGKAAMFMEGNWAISSVIHDAPKDISDNTGLAVVPAVDGGNGDPSDNSAGAAWAYCINPKLSGAQKTAAVKLIKAVTDSNYAKTAILASAIPASQPTGVDNSKLPSLVVKYLDLSTKLTPVPIYDSQLPAALIQVMNTGLQDLLIGTKTPQQLAQKIQDEYASEN